MPKTAVKTLDAKTRQRMVEGVNDTFDSLMWDFDISNGDVDPERPEWEAIRGRLVELMGVAYLRNHSC